LNESTFGIAPRPCGPWQLKQPKRPATSRPEPFSRDLEVSHRLHERHEIVGLLRRQAAAPRRHRDDRARPQLQLLGIVAYAARHAVEDPLADLGLVVRVHREQPARERGDLLEAMSGIGHAAEAARAVAGEAALPGGDRPSPLDTARKRAPPHADARRAQGQDDGDAGQRALGPRDSPPCRARAAADL
jgi:hypothetical protein